MSQQIWVAQLQSARIDGLDVEGAAEAHDHMIGIEDKMA